MGTNWNIETNIVPSFFYNFVQKQTALQALQLYALICLNAHFTQIIKYESMKLNEIFTKIDLSRCLFYKAFGFCVAIQD